MAAWPNGNYGYRYEYIEKAVCLSCIDPEHWDDGHWVCNRVIHDCLCLTRYGQTVAFDDSDDSVIITAVGWYSVCHFKVSSQDYNTSLLASMPGGLTQIVILAEETEGIN